MFRFIYLYSVILCLFLVSVARGFTPYDLEPYLDEFTIENRILEGEWKTEKKVGGLFCGGGGYSFGFDVLATVEDVKMEFTEKGEIQAEALLTNLSGKIKGSYRGELSACIPIKLSPRYRVDSFLVKAIVTFKPGEEGKQPEFTLRIQSTDFGTIHFTDLPLPLQFEEFFTGLVNSGAKKVWASELGRFIEKKVAEELKNKFPGGGDSPMLYAVSN